MFYRALKLIAFAMHVGNWQIINYCMEMGKHILPNKLVIAAYALTVVDPF